MTPAMQLVIDEEQANANTRMTAIRAAVLMTRSMELWRRERLDPQSVLIILSVISITSEKLIRAKLEPKYHALDVYLPLEELQGCNIASIAAASGLNRETVRRRVQGLIDGGSLIRTEAGEIALPPDRVQEPSAIELIQRQLGAIVRFANDALRDGILVAKD
ncbi:hypothetical protein OMW55_11725 [Sphingomonas sp. BN140010]|uniref:HTH crp-type domain-containing protein n=1 Tax=Sphingomonas arvum TaxID=2992113 RepID=A0ABT3JHB0_9SPHN|nr:hypothetical protein [Sphingomonas sp. BN140010]MCW3798474.1 hypothetical protein [Sphingomonas sp. BN140010]